MSKRLGIRKYGYLKRAGALMLALTLAVGMVPAIAGCDPPSSRPEFAGGSGTSTDPYQISDWYHLDSIRDHLDTHSILMNNLNAGTAGYEELAGPAANDGKGWEPIGQAELLEEGIVGEPFLGGFDGRGFEIRHLYIDRADENTAGLFGIVGEGGVISDVGVVDAEITGRFSVGTLAAVNMGVVSNSWSTGIVVGNSAVGGLVGGNAYGGTVSNSYSAASASGETVVGGLVGVNSRGTVVNSYATGSIARVYGSSDSFGGFVGRNRGGRIIDCYSTGSVSYQGAVQPTANGFAGTVSTDEDCEMAGNFWDAQASGQLATAGEATGLNTANMMTSPHTQPGASSPLTAPAGATMPTSGT